MFGRFTCPCRHTGKEFTISIVQDGESCHYQRECGDVRAEKIIVSAGPILVIQPVEPVNLPKEVTRFLEIVFEPLVIEPESEQTVYLTFPLEIGVFVAKEDEYQLIDVFSQCFPKYSLYGSPENGVITRYHRSRVFFTPPDPDPAREGILNLMIRNTSRGWVEVSRAVFEGYSMPIFYDRTAAMTGEMVLFSKTIAETRLLEKPPRPAMTPAIPAIRARKILLVDVEKKSFLMEHGVA